MLGRLAEQRRAINLYSVERGGIDNLTEQEWKLVERVVDVLQPFYDATLEICFDDACISVAIPIIAMLNVKLEAKTDDRGLLQLKAALRDAMTRRFASVKKTPHFIAATLLDPRFKDLYFDANEKEDAKSTILSFIRQMEAWNVEHHRAATAHSTDLPTSLSTNPTEVGEISKISNLWETHDSVSVVKQEETEATIPHYEQQLLDYLREPRVPRSTNIYAFWNCSQFPSLESVARKFLSTPPTSVASEQLFSAAGQIYADRRSNIIGENAEKLLFLAYNIRLFGFNY